MAGLFGERYGQGPPRYVALHGWGRDHTDFSKALDGVPAIALDLPGFGATPAPPSATGTAEYARAIVPVIESLPAAPVLIGHSFGGRLALHLATKGLASGLVLIGVPLLRLARQRRPPMGYRLRKALRFVLGEEGVERARNRYGSADYRAASGVMRDILVAAVNESYEEFLPRLGCPTELVWGSEDGEVPIEVARAAIELIPDARLTVVPKVGHHVLLAAPEVFREILARMP